VFLFFVFWFFFKIYLLQRERGREREREQEQGAEQRSQRGEADSPLSKESDAWSSPS